MRRLVPDEIEVMLAGFRPFEIITLVVIADVLAAKIDLVEPIPASGGHPDVRERSRAQVAVFIKFRQAIALRVVEEETPADLNAAVKPPIGDRIGSGHRL